MADTGRVLEVMSGPEGKIPFPLDQKSKMFVEFNV